MVYSWKWWEVDNDIVVKEINKYLKSKINATLELNTFTWGDDFENKLAAIIASGLHYDITFTANWANNYMENAKRGAFMDITNMMDTYAPKTKALLNENMLKGAKVNGKLYAIPTYNSSSSKTYGILLNKKLATKYKVDTTKIKKLSDLEPILKKIKAKEPKVIGFFPFDTYGSNSIYDTLGYEKIAGLNSPGAVKAIAKSTKVINDFDSADAKSLFTLMNKWYNSGYINKSIPSDYSSQIGEYFNKNMSNIFAFTGLVTPTRTQETRLSYGIDTVSVDLTKTTISTSEATGSMQAISSTSDDPERALMFLELVNTDEKLSNLINYGIEGVHYKKTGTKSIK